VSQNILLKDTSNIFILKKRLIMIKLKSILHEQVMLQGGDAATILKLEKCIGYSKIGMTDEECIYKLLQNLKYEDLLKMDKYFKGKGFKDTIHYIVDDFSGKELDKVLDLLFNIFAEAQERGSWPYDNRFARFMAHRYGKEPTYNL